MKELRLVRVGAWQANIVETGSIISIRRWRHEVEDSPLTTAVAALHRLHIVQLWEEDEHLLLAQYMEYEANVTLAAWWNKPAAVIGNTTRAKVPGPVNVGKLKMRPRVDNNH
ncbi:hypothetical protein PHLCEN_2v9771 [Hermanssonia centrifuga]|uniref:Uncharacterized protein n=1 Tax=Hermanssonia centrifuga TaxID=98765 RepID=A0A2R6NQ31_9APHY|nr:hypothetical protein PHLCEN_2v9771 [Hermanssonia centrifuga]